MNKIYKCFVIRPFNDTTFTLNGESRTIKRETWEHIYNVWIKPSVEDFPEVKIKCNCAELSPGIFIRDILSEIESSQFVIADLTGSRPNVYYELGIRHALRTGTIIMTQDPNSVPSDLKAYSYFPYKFPNYRSNDPKSIKSFAETLHTTFKKIIAKNWPSDSPVSDFLNLKHFFIDKLEMREVRSIYIFLTRLERVIKSYFQVLKRIIQLEATCITNNKFPTEIFNISLMNNLYAAFLQTPVEGIFNNQRHDLDDKLFTISDAFNAIYHSWDINGKTIVGENSKKYFSMVKFLLTKEADYEKFFEVVINRLKIEYKKLYNTELE